MKIVKSIHKYIDGSYSQFWHKEDDKDYYHREDGPALIKYNSDGSIDYERYWINGLIHRLDGPAAIRYNRDGSIRCESYYINNQRHRVDGPAYIRYNRDGSIACEEYWINGVEYDYKDWKKHKLVREYRINRILENELDYENC